MQRPFTIRLLGTFRDLSRIAGVVAGRALLSVTILLLLVMPFTEHFWTFDKFLRGGVDLELGMLAFITLLSMVYVLSQNRKQHVATLLAFRRFLSRLFRRATLGDRPCFYSRQRIPFSLELATASSIPLLYTLPLQV